MECIALPLMKQRIILFVCRSLFWKTQLIKKIESGKGNPSLSTVEKIMDILGMEVKYEIRQTV